MKPHFKFKSACLASQKLFTVNGEKQLYNRERGVNGAPGAGDTIFGETLHKYYNNFLVTVERLSVRIVHAR